MSVLAMFVKQPVAGQVKTRLAAAVGAEPAARLYAAFIADLSERFRRTADRRVLCYGPDSADARAYFGEIAGDEYGLWAQPDGPLGVRLGKFFEEEFRGGAGGVVVIGSDSPTLPESSVERAFELLEERDCVLGPAIDGGYYLVGLRGGLIPIFEGVEWSTAEVFAQTVGKVRGCGASLGLLEPWYDVDTLEDLRFLRGHVEGLRASGSHLSMPHTEAIVRQDTFSPSGAL